MDLSEQQRNAESRPRTSALAAAIRCLCLAGLAFVIGGVFSLMGWQPMRAVLEGFVATRTLVGEMTQTRSALLWPAFYPGNGVTVNDPARAQTGLTLIQGLLPGGPQVRLIDMSGREIHRWNIDFFAAWDAPTHIVPAANVPKSALHVHTQGFAVDRDGSLVANIGDKGAIRIDRCGAILWTVDRMTHHAVTPAGDGGYWVPGHLAIDGAPERLLPPNLGRDQVATAMVGRWDNPVNTVLKIDAAGRPVKEFIVLDALIDAGLEAVLNDGWTKSPLDPTHLNDIEVVTPALAAKIARVEAGDLLISLRTLNMLAILDREDGTLKWHRRGPWVRQHDPDITADGRIEIFNNRLKPAVREFGGSQIVSYDPATDTTTVLHPRGNDDTFYARIMGSHQRLANGNRLVVESTRGRVFEVTPGGDVVWNYVLAHDDGFAALIEHAERVPEDYFEVGDWTCADQ